ncbi:MAG: ABC transporter ATP-binding protein [Verrucomicrobiota bacterium]|nr:ABC transporter ATP-binding protein [Verrucomicrobiota bacterium]MDD8051288.1 ABC transporter ATP-binding protein [Verrucomicrobiota bacterium]MDI9384020.1 ABC transporter ATP-binding protein [Verrucomicrobiota bacterium]
MIKTTNIQHRYGEILALHDLNLEIPAQAIYGFIGPNGAGKSTTINILATLLRPTAGKAWVDGIEVSQHPMEVRRRVGYMPETFGVYEDMLLWEYLEFFAAAYKVPARKRGPIIDDVLTLTELHRLRDRRLDSLSRGMRQRLCLAKTLVHDPKVLLLDEPASGLDPRARIEFRGLLQTLAEMGKTILVSSHILAELSRVCSHIGILESGRLLASGPVAEVLSSVRAHRRIRVECTASAASAKELVMEMQQVRDPVLDEHVLFFDFLGTNDELAAIPAVLLENGIRFSSFSEQGINLEDLFLEITTGDIQ